MAVSEETAKNENAFPQRQQMDALRKSVFSFTFISLRWLRFLPARLLEAPQPEMQSGTDMRLL